jgi:hypothetical protein
MYLSYIFYKFNPAPPNYTPYLEFELSICCCGGLDIYIFFKKILSKIGQIVKMWDFIYFVCFVIHEDTNWPQGPWQQKN